MTHKEKEEMRDDKIRHNVQLDLEAEAREADEDTQPEEKEYSLEDHD